MSSNSNSANRAADLAILTIIVLVILGLYWLGIALLQLLLAIVTTIQGTNPQWILYAVAGWNIVMSIFNLFEIRGVRRRYSGARKSLRNLFLLGTAWSGLTLMFGQWAQLLPLLLYIALGILVRVNADYYTEMPPQKTQAVDGTGDEPGWLQRMNPLVYIALMVGGLFVCLFGVGALLYNVPHGAQTAGAVARPTAIAYKTIPSLPGLLYPTEAAPVMETLDAISNELATARARATLETETPEPVTPSATIPPAQVSETAVAAQVTAQAAEPLLGLVKTWRVLVNDSFDSNANGWQFGNDKQITDGKYKWHIQEYWNVARGLPNNAPVGDFYAAIDAKLMQGNADCGMGLTFRNNAEGEYIVYFQNDGRWGFDIIHSPDPGIAQHGVSDVIVPNVQNRISVIAQGPDMKFFINGKYVGQARDSTITSGQVGAAVWNLGDGACRVEFDNFELRAP